ncbi:hypothetical protein AJ80_03718 [Polytolypa hystricis UAMH7299]|uniref:Protein rds1 n=1 Tax=Polytolypa hystricis (strain UAMH7299) TaxID=1447883 RepID=A0A2B7YGM6_POLH7|nr:hypothetical protein AJ80_03718 [Polytolypa hystricis UAMH7299]
MARNPLYLALLAPLVHYAKAAPQAGNAAQITYADGVVVPATPPVRTGMPVSHGPFTGVATMTGALTAPTVLGTAITGRPPSSAATTYPSDGNLHDPMLIPYAPGGGLGTNGTAPVYNVKSDFDYQSLALALYVEWFEMDLFRYGLSQFSQAEFAAVGLTPEDLYLIQFMAEQEIGHATLISNILGPSAPKQCNYNYPFTTVSEFLDFSQKIARIGESSVYGFLPHLDSRAAASLLLQSIAVEARQQVIFRQFMGLFPMPVWFEVGVPQSWAWTLLAPYISSCPADQTRLAWQNFPALTIVNQPNPVLTNGSMAFNQTISPGTNTLNSTGIPSNQSCVNATTPLADCKAAISSNRTIPLSAAGREVSLTWDLPGKQVGPENSYITTSQAGPAKFVAWVTQLNITYSPLTGLTGGGGGGGGNMTGGGNATNTTGTMSGKTIQPDLSTFMGDPAINGTIFIAITDSNPYLTPFNLSLINPHVVAGPALYQAG